MDCPESISIGTISGGTVNFGGAVNVSPISVQKTINTPGGSTNLKSPDEALNLILQQIEKITHCLGGK
ncbi:MAG: hypothetical protein Q8934_08400 [Bacillota bacterium]|nr:hypothetical protein [Bacillota bacterium]